MTNTNDVRRAHDVLDDISIGHQPNEGNLNHLRSFLPELPKQKTLEEITEHVYDAWAGTEINEWPDDIHGEPETWLSELHIQLQGLKDTPIAVLALPAGIRLADHEGYGRVVVSPKPDQDGVYILLVPRPRAERGADWEYAHEDELTFIDAEPAKSAHPEFLETEADYAAAPEGTVVAVNGSKIPTVKDDGWPVHMAVMRRRILRWGDGE